jgi:hypothetical protein
MWASRTPGGFILLYACGQAGLVDFLAATLNQNEQYYDRQHSENDANKRYIFHV